MKRDVIIGQKLFETCKLSEFYLNLIVNSKYEDESPFQLAKAYTQKLYEIVERYDRLLEANSQRENLTIQLDSNTNSRTPSAAPSKPSKSVCSTPVASSTLQSQARTSTPNKCFTSPSSSLATQLQLQLQMQQLHSQSTPATPCQSTSASSINLAAHNTSASSAQQHHGGMRQSSSNYQLGSSKRANGVRTASTYKLNSISNSNINSNFYKQNQQRLYSIYYDDYFTSDDEVDGEADEDDEEVAGYGEDELTVRNDYSGAVGHLNYKTMTISSSKLTKGGARAKKSRKSRRDSLVDGEMDMDSTILSSHNHNVSVRLDDISYDYGEYQHDTQIDLDETSSHHNLASSGVSGAGAVSAASGASGNESQAAIEKSYSNLSKDSGVLIDSYHSDYSSHHLLNLTNNSSLTPNSARQALSSVRGSKANELLETPVTAVKPLRKGGDKSASARKPSAKGTLASNGGTTSSSASISDNDETNAELENQLLSHSRLNQYIQSDDGANETINYADDDVYDDYDGHHHVEDQDDEDDDFDEDDDDDDDDEEDDDEEPHQYNITDSTHILLKKKAAKRNSQASSSLIAKLKSPQQKESTSLAKLTAAASNVNTSQQSPYSHYAKNPNKYSPIRASKLAFMPNKSSLISSRQQPNVSANPGQEFDFMNKKQLSLIAEKQSEMDDHLESSDSLTAEESKQSGFNQQLNLDLDISMISMMVESDEQRRLRTAQSSPKTTTTTTSIDQKVKLFSNKIESLTNRLKNDEPSNNSNTSMNNSYSSSSTLSTPSPTSSSASSSTGGNSSSAETTVNNNNESITTSIPPTPSPYSAASTKSSPQFLFNSISSMNVSMLDNIQATNTSLDFDNMNTSILMFN